MDQTVFHHNYIPSDNGPLSSMCKWLRDFLISRISITAKITNMLNAGADCFIAQDFRIAMLAAMKEVAREFYVAAKYGVPFKNPEEFDRHEADIKARYNVENPYSLELHFGKVSGLNRVRIWRQIMNALTETLVVDLKISEVTGIKIEPSSFDIYDYNSIVDYITNVHQPTASATWNEIGTFLHREATDKSIWDNIQASEEAVYRITDCFSDYPSGLESYLFASTLLETMYRDVFPFANAKMEPELRAVINNMLINKVPINGLTLREAITKTIIPTFEERGPLVENVVRSDRRMNYGALQIIPKSETIPKTPGPKKGFTVVARPNPHVNVSTVAKKGRKPKLPNCTICKKNTHVEEKCPWTRDGKQSSYWSTTFPERPPFNTAARRAYDARHPQVPRQQG